MKRLWYGFISLFLFSILLTGCSSNENVIKLGVSGSDSKVWEYIQQYAEEEQGVTIELVKFTDYVQPNLALAEGDIDANAFQTVAYFNEFKKERNLDLTAIGSTVIAPMGIYSKKHQDVKQIPNGSTITIPNDATNGGRALLLLEKAGLIGLKTGFNGVGLTEAIVDNPKNLTIKPIAAPQTPRSLDDAAAAVINNNFAVDAGYNPIQDAILAEDETAERYINIIAVQSKDKDKAQLKKLVTLFQTDKVKKFIDKTYKGSQIPAFVPLSEIDSL